MSQLIPYAKPYYCPLVHMHPVTLFRFLTVYSLSKSMYVFFSNPIPYTQILHINMSSVSHTNSELPRVSIRSAVERWCCFLKFPNLGLYNWEEVISVLFFKHKTSCLTHHAWKHARRAHSKFQATDAYGLQLQNLLIYRTRSPVTFSH